jgi:hypothetical protein
MNSQLIDHIKEILALRNSLTTICKVSQSSEIMKIWARWIITHRSMFKQKSLFLPDDNVYDVQLVKEIVDKDCSHDHAVYIHNWLWENTTRINRRYRLLAEAETGGIHGTIPIIVTHNNKSVNLGLSSSDSDNLIANIPVSVYQKMRREYEEYTMMPASCCDSAIWTTVILYGMLDGKGLQWAVPPPFLQYLSKMGCNTELFGSPINHYYPNYYSLFDIDRTFGARGNFFTAPDSDFLQGCYQVNPPFIDAIFTKTTNRILGLLDSAVKKGTELTFVYVMPQWDDFFTMSAVTDSRYCVNHITLDADKHCYYEYSTNCYIRAKFRTSVIFLSTNYHCAGHISPKQIYNLFKRPISQFHTRS